MATVLRLLCMLGVLCGFAACDGASAQAKRVALVIGNSAYKIGVLANPGNDAKAVAVAFEVLGFDVTLHHDLAYDAMIRALRAFAPKANGAEIAALYFAGHGTEQSGRNFLLPTDAILARASDLEVEAVSLDTVLSQIGGATRLRLVILDACRNTIFPLSGSKRSTSRGLARVEPDENTLVAYAAKEGTLADDGEAAQHSPFTTALLKHLVTPGVEIDYVFRLVRDDVLAATGRRQQPHVYGTLGRERIVLRASDAPSVAPPPPADASAFTARLRQRIASAKTIEELETIASIEPALAAEVEARKRSLIPNGAKRDAGLAPQSSASVNELKFDRTYGPGWPMGILSLPNGDLVVALQVGVAGKTDAKLMRLAGTGEIVWTHTFQSKLIQSGHLTLGTDGEIVLIGENRTTVSLPIWVLRAGSDGRIRSDASFDGPPSTFQRMRTIIDSATITVMGDEYLFTGKSNAQLFRYNANGVFLGKLKIDATKDGTHLLAPMVGGGFVASWLAPEDPATPTRGFPVVARFDKNGLRLWQTRAAATHLHHPSVLTSLADGRVAVAGYLDVSVASGQHSLWYSVLDPRGSLQRSTRFGRYPVAVPTTIAAVPDGNVAIGGCAQFRGIQDVYDPWIVLLSPTGAEVSEIKRPKDKGGTVLALISMSGGAFAAAGISGNGCGWFDGVVDGADTWVQVTDR